MHDDVEAPPFPFDAREHRLELAGTETSSGMKIVAFSRLAIGSTNGFVFSLT